MALYSTSQPVHGDGNRGESFHLREGGVQPGIFGVVTVAQGLLSLSVGGLVRDRRGAVASGNGG